MARGDEPEVDRLVKSSPKKTYKMGDDAYTRRLEAMNEICRALCLDLAKAQGKLETINIVQCLLSVMIEKYPKSQNKKEKEKKKLDSKAKVRARGECCLPAEHSMVTDNKDHYPITSRAQALNAISRVNQHSEAPPWFKGSLKSLIDIVYRKDTASPREVIFIERPHVEGH
jgi:hypothetical protein